MKKAKVFLDTSVLLKGFLSYRKLVTQDIDISQMQDFISDTDTIKFTFEKCIYEAYLAFRGVGGKKPSEGRGNWAQNFLKSSDDPKPLSHISSKFHDDNNPRAFFWANNINTIVVEELERSINLINNSDKAKFLEEQEKLRHLVRNNNLFLSLCDDFNQMIRFFEIRELSYFEVFGRNEETDLFLSFTLPTSLNSFCRETAIPSEDFEILYAAERIGADLFVTDDNGLIGCSTSLGLNNFLQPSAFCRSENYLNTKAKWLSR